MSLTPAKTLIQSGTYFIASSLDSNSVLDSRYPQENVIGSPKKTSFAENQLWELKIEETPDGSMRCAIYNDFARKFLLPESEENNANLIGGNDESQGGWIILVAGAVEGSVGSLNMPRIVLFREDSTLCATLPSAGAGTQAVVREWNKGAEQYFVLQKPPRRSNTDVAL